MKGYRRAAAVILGMVLVLSGILKLMDPVGTRLIVGDYFNFFHLGFLSFSAPVLSFILAIVEAVTGLALITGIKRQVTAFVSAALLFFFTVLTLVLWIANPSMDCGCFGEAVHLTHAQSFLKNIAFCILWAIVFIPVRNYGEAKKVKNATFALGCISVIAFGVAELFFLPFVDFTTMSPGSELFNVSQEDMAADAPVLSFYDGNFEYRDSLALEENVIVVSVYNVDAMEDEDWRKAQEFLHSAAEIGYSTILLASARPQESRMFADPRTLMTLNRSNAGATYISDGQIIRKWSGRAYPDGDSLKEIITSDSTEVMIDSSSWGKTGFQAFLLYVFAVVLLI